MSATDDLITWNSRWRLKDSTVYCKTCGASQKEADKAAIFEHLAGCGHAGQGSRPWDDLGIALASLKRETLD